MRFQRRRGSHSGQAAAYDDDPCGGWRLRR
jgi:hypothetical protein